MEILTTLRSDCILINVNVIGTVVDNGKSTGFSPTSIRMNGDNLYGYNDVFNSLSDILVDNGKSTVSW